MAKCGACGRRFLSATEGAKCDICRSWYHRDCVGVDSSGCLTAPWHCPECTKNLMRDNRAETPVRGHTQAPQDDSIANLMETSPINNTALDATQQLNLHIKAELQKFKDDIINTVRHEFLLLRDEFTELRSSLKATNDRISSLEERVAVIENQKQALPKDSQDVHEMIAQLRSDINDRDQALLSADIQISNLPETCGENPIHTTLLIATKMGVNIETRDIVSAERVGSRRINATQASPAGSRPRLLVVRLARRDLRDEMLIAARSRRGMTSADLDISGPAARFYVNERLTKVNRELFRRAREAGSRLGWQFIWAKRGRILARNKPGDPACHIRCETDLLRVFGPETVLDGHKTP